MDQDNSGTKNKKIKTRQGKQVKRTENTKQLLK